MVSEKDQRQQLYIVIINGLGGGCKEGPAVSTPEGVTTDLGNTVDPLTTWVWIVGSTYMWISFNKINTYCTVNVFSLPYDFNDTFFSLL